MKPDHRARVQRLLAAQRFDEARVTLDRHCRDETRDTEAWFLLSTINGQLARYEDVVRCCKHILACQPKHAGACAHLGNANTALGRFDEAIAWHRKALGLLPNDPGTHSNLGYALFQAGEMQEAERHFRRALELAPASLEAQYNLANLLMARDEPEEAIRRYEAVLRLSPRLHHAYRQMGTALKQMGELTRASEAYQRALALQPDDIDAWCGLALAANERGMQDQAIAWFQRALVLKPDSVTALCGMAKASLDKGDFGTALDVYKRALGVDPESMEAQSGIADVAVRQGDLERAYGWARTRHEEGKGNAEVALVLAAVCRKFDYCHETLDLIERLVAAGKVHVGLRRALHYAAGELYDRLESHDKAFAHFRQANELSAYRFDFHRHTAWIEGLMRAYGKEDMKRFPRAAHGSQRPIFIVGMPRSGTSLVEQILASHPAVFGAGELNDLNMIAMEMPGRISSRQPYPTCLNELTPERVNTIAGAYLDRLENLDSTALRVTDKMPNNYLHLGLINLLFPEAHVIHCRRDPRDTCLSIYFQSFSAAHPYAVDLASVGHYYREYRRLMDHWKDALELPMFDVSYEALVQDPEKLSRELVAFCGLEWHPRCLEFYKSARTVSTASYEQVRQPIYTRSLGRWRHYESHLGPLLQVLSAPSA